MNEKQEIEMINEISRVLRQLKTVDEIANEMLRSKAALEHEIKRMANSVGFIIDMENYVILKSEDAEF